MRNERILFNSWNPISELPRDLIVEAVSDDNDGFRMHLKQRGESRILCLTFDPVLTYRSIEESLMIKYARGDVGELDRYSLFTVSDSDYLKWFSQVSQGTRTDTVHYAVYLSNQCVDVISDYTPQVNWL